MARKYNISTLSIKFDANTKLFVAGVDQVENKLRGFQSELKAIQANARRKGPTGALIGVRKQDLERLQQMAGSLGLTAKQTRHLKREIATLQGQGYVKPAELAQIEGLIGQYIRLQGVVNRAAAAEKNRQNQQKVADAKQAKKEAEMASKQAQAQATAMAKVEADNIERARIARREMARQTSLEALEKQRSLKAVNRELEKTKEGIRNAQQRSKLSKKESEELQRQIGYFKSLNNLQARLTREADRAHRARSASTRAILEASNNAKRMVTNSKLTAQEMAAVRSRIAEIVAATRQSRGINGLDPRQLGRMKESLRQVADQIRAINKARSQSAGGGGPIASFIQGIPKLAAGLVLVTALGKAIQAVQDVARATAAQILKSTVAFERFNTTLQVLTKSAFQTTQVNRELVEFAKTTPFNLEELRAATTQLSGYGFQASSLVDTMRLLGNLAARTNANISDLTYVLGTSRNEGILFTRDVQQFAKRGIPIWQALAEQMGEPVSALRTLASEGKITFPVLLNALNDISAEADVLTTRSKTLEGEWSNLVDSFEVAAGALGTKFLPAAKSTVGILRDLTDEIQETTESGNGLVDVIANSLNTAMAGWRMKIQEVRKANARLAESLGMRSEFTVQQFEKIDDAIGDMRAEYHRLLQLSRENPLTIEAGEKLQNLEKHLKRVRQELEAGEITATEAVAAMKGYEKVGDTLADVGKRLDRLNDKVANLERPIEVEIADGMNSFDNILKSARSNTEKLHDELAAIYELAAKSEALGKPLDPVEMGKVLDKIKADANKNSPLEKAKKDAEKIAERIRESIRTPSEVLRDELQQIEEARRRGLLTMDEAKTAADKAVKAAEKQAQATEDNTRALDEAKAAATKGSSNAADILSRRLELGSPASLDSDTVRQEAAQRAAKVVADESAKAAAASQEIADAIANAKKDGQEAAALLVDPLNKARREAKGIAEEQKESAKTVAAEVGPELTEAAKQARELNKELLARYGEGSEAHKALAEVEANPERYNNQNIQQHISNLMDAIKRDQAAAAADAALMVANLHAKPAAANPFASSEAMDQVRQTLLATKAMRDSAIDGSRVQAAAAGAVAVMQDMIREQAASGMTDEILQQKISAVADAARQNVKEARKEDVKAYQDATKEQTNKLTSNTKSSTNQIVSAINGLSRQLEVELIDA